MEKTVAKFRSFTEAAKADRAYYEDLVVKSRSGQAGSLTFWYRTLRSLISQPSTANSQLNS